mmetsp:Transcript_12029/g.23459  ORF Transcript_12029/g.23459 Transcript_12029/m.23459 type:complete len:180 (-) Transcript_12029:275-814(-)
MSKMSLPPRQHNEQQQVFLRQATILRKNLGAWDATLRSARGGDWPSMLGRLNAAFNQAGNLDQGIEDASEHFVYVPRKCTVNAQDIAFFLSTRLATAASSEENSDDNNIDPNNNFNEGGENAALMGMDVMAMGGAGDVAARSSSSQHYFGGEEPAKRLRRYESQVASLASEFEDGMVRF